MAHLVQVWVGEVGPSAAGYDGLHDGRPDVLCGHLQIRVAAGKDPSTGERIVLVGSVPIAKSGKERSDY